MKDLPTRDVDRLREIARHVGAPGQVLVLEGSGRVVLTSPFTKWEVPADPGDRLALVEEIAREIRASSTDNPLLKYMYRKGISFRQMGAILGLSHVRVQQICKSNPDDPLRNRIALLIPEVPVGSWPKPAARGRPRLRPVVAKMKRFYGE